MSNSTDTQVASLVEMITAADVGEGEIDELVCDMACSHAARTANHGADILAVYDDAERHAAAINNGGLSEQVQYLLDTFGERQLLAWITSNK